MTEPDIFTVIPAVAFIAAIPFAVIITIGLASALLTPSLLILVTVLLIANLNVFLKPSWVDWSQVGASPVRDGLGIVALMIGYPIMMFLIGLAISWVWKLFLWMMVSINYSNEIRSLGRQIKTFEGVEKSYNCEISAAQNDHTRKYLEDEQKETQKLIDGLKESRQKLKEIDKLHDDSYQDFITSVKDDYNWLISKLVK